MFVSAPPAPIDGLSRKRSAIASIERQPGVAISA
jgi:hypothetical protein